VYRPRSCCNQAITLRTHRERNSDTSNGIRLGIIDFKEDVRRPDKNEPPLLCDCLMEAFSSRSDPIAVRPHPNTKILIFIKEEQ
jgi:hypothetical protein